jgi:hypothetical protein
VERCLACEAEGVATGGAATFRNHMTRRLIGQATLHGSDRIGLASEAALHRCVPARFRRSRRSRRLQVPSLATMAGQG